MPIYVEPQPRPTWPRTDPARGQALSPERPPRAGWDEWAKRALDFTLALVLLALASPLLLLAALAVKLTSRGPVLYSQTRVGKGGKPYTIYKLRTMTHNC